MRRAKDKLAESRGPGPMTWLQLAVMLVALVGLLLVIPKLGSGSAGCFMQLTETPDAVAPAPAEAPTTSVQKRPAVEPPRDVEAAP